MPGWAESADLARQLGEAEGGGAGILGGLQHHGIAHGEGGRQRAADHLRRIVPGEDVAGDAVRFMHDADVIAVQEGNDVAMDLVGGAAIELEIADGRVDVGARLAHRLAGIAGLQPGQLVEMILDLEGELRDQPAPLGRGETPPGPLEGGAGSLDREVDIGGVAAGDAGEFLARRGVEPGEGFTRLASDIAAIDEVLIHVRSQSLFASAALGGSAGKLTAGPLRRKPPPAHRRSRRRHLTGPRSACSCHGFCQRKRPGPCHGRAAMLKQRGHSPHHPTAAAPE